MSNNTENQSQQKPDLHCALVDNLGIEVISFKEGEVVATMPVDDRTCQPWGILNGGASLALAEMLAGYGSVPLCEPGYVPCGIQVSANHLSMVRKGSTVTATAKILHRGRATHVWNVDLVTPSGRLCCSVRVTNTIIKAPER